MPLTLHATESGETLVDISTWIECNWLGPGNVDFDPAARLAVLRLEQAVDHDGVTARPGLPVREHVRSTAWFEEYKSPVVTCRLLVREAVEVRFRTDEPEFVVLSFDWLSEERVLRFEKTLDIQVAALDITLEASDEVVRHLRRREWRRGPLGVSTTPWEE